MLSLEIYENVKKDILIWIEKEKKYKFKNMVDFFTLLDKIDIKISLKYKLDDDELPVFIHHFQEISNYSNIANRILELELYLNVKYGLKLINQLKKNVIDSLLSFHRFYPNDFLSKKELNLFLKEYNFILILILIQLNI